MCFLVCLLAQVIEAAIESGVDDVEVVEGDDEGTSWILTTPKDLMTLAGLHQLGVSSPHVSFLFQKQSTTRNERTPTRATWRVPSPKARVEFLTVTVR